MSPQITTNAAVSAIISTRYYFMSRMVLDYTDEKDATFEPDSAPAEEGDKEDGDAEADPVGQNDVVHIGRLCVVTQRDPHRYSDQCQPQRLTHNGLFKARDTAKAMEAT